MLSPNSSPAGSQTSQNKPESHAASFRDPSGFVFRDAGQIKRSVTTLGQADYESLMSSGLYAELTAAHLLVTHTEQPGRHDGEYKVLVPAQLPFISYPYEWSFSQLQDAALATLDIQTRALAHGLCLKDASAYNVQFVGSRPIFIDTSSFVRYTDGEPWVAYRQFCQHFLAPLAVMAKRDIRLQQLLRVYVDGLPLDLAAKLLPARARLSPLLASHIFLHAANQRRHAAQPVAPKKFHVAKSGLQAIIASLRTAVQGLHWRATGTEWAEYYQHTNYSDDGLRAKEVLVTEFLATVKPTSVWDLGANNGRFSRLASQAGIRTVAMDIDPAAVETLYRTTRTTPEPITPLIMDLTNPSPNLGWAEAERESLAARAPADVVMALALVHHLAIGNNVPLPTILSYFARLGEWLIVEFIPKSDSQVQRLLTGRTDIFSRYTADDFTAALQEKYVIVRTEPIPGTARTLYLAHRQARS